MPTVDFYLLENPSSDAVNLTTCKLCEKAYEQQKTVFIYSKTKQDAENLDKLLWTYNDISFIPHALIPAKTPILIGFSGSPPPANYDILINLTSESPSFFNQFNRVIEVVSGDAAEKQVAREKYRFYRDNQCELKSHQLQK
ncbi:MAG TPA: DNA polymerase III subunit chi [Gammaproteobacteria bacterium]|nr:DNA polymerase III subunit chi [Gammaproteobacteria bacterium]